MQLLICSGYHSPDLTHDFMQALLQVLTPDRLWIRPIWSAPELGPWILSASAPQQDRLLHVIAFSAGVVVAYPLLMAWQHMGGTSRCIAIDGWGMPLLGNLDIYRMSHDRWTHNTTYFPSPQESQGYFYSDPAVDHLAIWQTPHTTHGFGAINTTAGPMTALQFICTVLSLA